jgi:hypothetical protein
MKRMIAIFSLVLALAVASFGTATMAAQHTSGKLNDQQRQFRGAA